MRKKLAAILVALSVLLSFAVPVFADDADSLSASSIQLKPGETADLVAASTSSQVVWASSDQSVATVDGFGKVTGVKLGRTTVSVTFSDGETKTCAVNVAYKGIDVSDHNGTIDWSAVKNDGFDFAIIRTGYGGDTDCWSQQTDKQFETNYANAVQNGLKVGAYHYSYATNVTMAGQEADFCLHVLNGRHLDYPVIYDVEDKSQYGLSSDALGQIVQTFCSKIQQAGYKTAVYSFVNFYNAHLTSSLVSQYDTWIAATGGVSSPESAGFSRPYTMWQHAVDSIAGVGTLDSDYSYCDYGGTGSSVTAPTNLDPMAFLCDTSSYTFNTNRQYVYKITTADTIAPSAVSSNPAAVTVSSARATANGYLFTLTNVGAGTATITTTAGDGRSVSFQAVSNGAPAAPAPSAPAAPSPTGGNTTPSSGIGSDTPYYFTMKKGGAYQFKFTATSGVSYSFSCADGSVVRPISSRKAGASTYYKISGAGKGCTGIYATAKGSSSVRVCIVTVA